MANSLSRYNSIGELEKVFDVERIENESDFDKLICSVDEADNDSLYRGVSSARYKMYSSSQRFYQDNPIWKKKYEEFLKRLFDVSKEIDDGFFTKLYDKLKDDNYLYVHNDESNKEYLKYNPIWAYCILQHVTMCSPFLDFSKNFYVALYFAAKEIIENGYAFNNEDNSQNGIDDYIEIIAIENESGLINMNNSLTGVNKYKSLIYDLIGDKNDLKDAKSAIESYDITQCKADCIRHISYGGFCKTLVGNLPQINYKFSFENKNAILQECRQFLTPVDNIPFEELWNKTFEYVKMPEGKSKKLKSYLIHKSLLPKILKKISKIVQPIERDYKDEILKLVKSVL